jgi:hypothetical protein
MNVGKERHRRPEDISEDGGKNYPRDLALRRKTRVG